MTRNGYITLIASLPRLVHFERAERVPINRPRLDQRLSMLSAADAAQLRDAESLFSWERLPLMRTAAQFGEQYRKNRARLDNPAIVGFIDARIEQRTLVAALRKRRRGERPMAGREIWGAGSRTHWIEGHWDEPHFGLQRQHIWLPEAKRLIDSRDAVTLERLLLNLLWTLLARIADDHPFAFEEVFAYVFRWDIVNRWLMYRPDAARSRFNDLMMEAIREHQPLFSAH